MDAQHVECGTEYGQLDGAALIVTSSTQSALPKVSALWPKVHP